MASIKEIKTHIESVRDTRKITNAMYLIASTKLRRAKAELDATRPYFNALRGEIKRIRREDVGARRLHAVGEIEQHGAARLVRRGVHRGGRRLRAFFQFENVVVDFHGVFPLVWFLRLPLGEAGAVGD